MLDVTRAYGLDLLFPAGDSAVGRCLRVFGEFARVEQDLLADYLSALPPGPVLDVGANIGSVCLPLARRFPDRRFLAVEAHRGLAGVLAANAINNQLWNVETHHAAVSDRDGLLTFPATPLDARGNFGTLAVGEGEAVLAVTLDTLAPPDTRLVKIDVEGHEERVLAGAGRVLREVRPVVLLEVGDRSQEARMALFAPLLAAGYRVCWFWSPFVSGKAPKTPGSEAKLQGDFCALALPEGVPNLWNLPSVDEPRPQKVGCLPYAARYGLARP